MEINKLLTPYNFKAGTADRIKYIVIHYVGATGGAEANCKWYAGGNRSASAHYFVDFDGSIWQSVEDKDIAWHCGAKSYIHSECRNANSIGIEMCVRNNGSKADTSRDWYFEDATVNAAIELTRELMDKYHILADHVIRHYDVTGKICPNPYVLNEDRWQQFKDAIATSQQEPGWIKCGDRWQYLRANGTYMRNGWLLINHYWYLFDQEGWVLTGWQQKDGKWFYLEESGDYEGACWHECEKRNGSQERWYVE